MGVISHGNDPEKNLPQDKVHVDLICLIRILFRELSVSVDFIYVPGHQDNDIPRYLLTQEQKLDVDMDTLAKKILRRAIRNNHYIDSAFPCEPLQLSLQGKRSFVLQLKPWWRLSAITLVCCRRHIFVTISQIREPQPSDAAKYELEQQSVCHSRDLLRQFTEKSEDICCIIAMAPAIDLLIVEKKVPNRWASLFFKKNIWDNINIIYYPILPFGYILLKYTFLRRGFLLDLLLAGTQCCVSLEVNLFGRTDSRGTSKDKYCQFSHSHKNPATVQGTIVLDSNTPVLQVQT